jgi:hypothetical protein
MGVAPESLLRIVDEETAIRVNDAMTLEFEPGHGRKLPPLVFQDMMQNYEPAPENWAPPVRIPEEQAELDRAFGVC